MKMTDLKPARTFAYQYGVKVLCYGGPGSGKTPIVNTAPNPVLMAVEPGLLSMNTSNVPTFQAESVEKIDEFFDWFFYSGESKNFDTLAIDSLTEIAEIVLADELIKHKHGLKAYGELSAKVMDWVKQLYFCKDKNIYIICKEGRKDYGEFEKLCPIFPGKDLNVKISHLFDSIWHLARCIVPGAVGPQLAFRTKESINITARDRSGRLNEFEPPNLTNIFKKCMTVNDISKEMLQTKKPLPPQKNK